MTATSSFTAPAFNLLSAVQMSGTVVRVRYSIDPLLVDDAGANDGLNPANYVLSGPIAAVIGDVNAVTDDTQAVDLVLVAPLVTGTWAVAVSNVRTADGASLSNPTTLTFEAVTTPTVTDPNAGAVNIDAKDVLRRHFSPAFKGRAWDAVLEALAVGDKANADNAQLAFDQLFKCTASGKYLDKVCADDNVRRPALLGMSDEPFRQYAIKTTNERLTSKSVWEILEIFYGSDAVKANATTVNYEPFNLTDGETLTFCVDELQDIEVEFKSSDFVSASAATALEVAAAITRACVKASSKAYALSYFEPESKTTRVRLFSNTIGPKSSVRITGGTAQNKLQFPGKILDYPWGNFGESGCMVSENVTDGYVSFVCDDCDDGYPMSLKKGDYVIITESSCPLQGTFEIDYVSQSVQYYTWEFRIKTDRQYGFQPISLLNPTGFAFYRSIKNTVSMSDRGIVVSSTPSGTTVSVPATTQTVNRDPDSAAYGQLPTALPIASIEGPHNAIVVDIGAHSIQTGDHVIVDGVYPQPAYPNYTFPTFNATLAKGALAVGPLAMMISLPSLTLQIQRKYGAACYGDNRAFVCGGHSGHAVMRSVGVLLVEADGTFYRSHSPTALPTAVYKTKAVMHGPECPNYWSVAVVHGLTAEATPTNKIQVSAKNATLWTEVAIGTARSGHEAVACSNGRIFVGPGNNGGTGAVDECFTFVIDPSNVLHKDADTYNVLYSRYDYGACAFGNGSVLLVGGRNPADAVRTAECEVFEFGAGFRRIAPMSCPRATPGVAKLPDGRIVVVGDDGLATGAVGLQSAEIWDPATEKWEKLPPPNGECNQPFVYWNDVMKKVVVIAKKYVSGYGAPHVEAFDPVSGKWTNVYVPGAAASLPASSVCAGEGRAFSFGGLAIGSAVSSAVIAMTPGELTLSVKNVNGIHKVTNTSATTITIATSEPGCFTNKFNVGIVTPVKAPSSDAIGPYLFDPNSGFAITGIATATTQSIEADRTYSQVTVSDNGDFPNKEGWLVFGFGTEYETGPVRYFHTSTGALVLDSNFKFPVALPSGVTVTLLANRGPFEPQNVPGSFYLTASSAGRVAAQNAIIESAPIGVPVNVDVSYPSDRGLGNEGCPTTGADKLSDKVAVWGGDDLDSEIEDLREE